MTSFKARFPGKPVKRYFSGSNKQVQRISYHEGEAENGIDLSELISSEAEIVNRAKVFRQLFGSSDDDSISGFDEVLAKRLKDKHEQIQQEMKFLNIQLGQFGVKPNEAVMLDDSAKMQISPGVSAVTDMLDQPGYAASGVLKGNTPGKTRQSLTPASTKPEIITPPVPLAALQLIPGDSSRSFIGAIPTVKYARDIPNNSSHRSGKFIVEVEEDTDSDIDEENIENLFPSPYGGQSLPGHDWSPDENQSRESLIRLNQCPMDIQSVCDHGFSIIIDRAHGSVPPMPLCFRCGSAGIGQLISCSSCCERYHPFCTGDEKLLSSYLSWDASASTEYRRKENSDLHSEQAGWIEFKTYLLSWTCQRCYFCYVCKTHTDSQEDSTKFLKCPFCPRVIHHNCCTGSKKWTSNTRVCDYCYKCASCGKRIERRTGQGGNGRCKDDSTQLPLCPDCLRQKKKGSYCPICSVCYDDNDFDTKMMECAKCEHWIHADCENITNEQYQILSNLPDSVEYICRICEDPENIYWRKAIELRIESDWKEVINIFQQKINNSCRKLRVLQPSCADNTPVKDIHPTPKLPSPSSKENSTIVRDLFPKSTSSKTEISTPESVKVGPLSTSSRKASLSELLGLECSIFLQDCTKFPNSVLLNKSEAKFSQMPVILAGASVELENCKTPAKIELKLPCTPVVCPFKRIYSFLEGITAEFKSRHHGTASVTEIHQRIVTFISVLEDDDSKTQHNLKLNFESAFTAIFSWFKDLELEVVAHNKENNETCSGNFQKENEIRLDEDSFKYLEISAEETLNWNPFEEFYWEKGLETDQRLCAFCVKIGESEPEGRLLWAGLTEWVHLNCALWSSEVWEDENGALKQVGVALTRSKGLLCRICGGKGASVSCCVQSCSKSFHFRCALRSSCILLEDKSMFCSEHINKAKGQRVQNLKVLRPIFVDTDWMRKKDKVALSTNIGVYIGSLKIESLGHLAQLSVHRETEEVTTLVPLGYETSRIFWTLDPSVSPIQKVKYSITTVVKRQEARRSKYCRISPDINIRVDHTRSPKRIHRKLEQVKSFHGWLDSAPKYVDEYQEEWIYPCRLQFNESESSGSDADIEDDSDEFESYTSASNISGEDDLFKNCLTQAEVQDLSECVDDVLSMYYDWGALSSKNGVEEVDVMSCLSSSSSDTDDEIADTGAETETEDILDINTDIEVEDCIVASDAETDDDDLVDTGAETEDQDGSLVDSGAETEDDEHVWNKMPKISSILTRKDQRQSVIPQIDGGGDSDSSESEDEESTSSSSSNSSRSDNEEIPTPRKFPTRSTRASNPTNTPSKPSIQTKQAKSSKLPKRLGSSSRAQTQIEKKIPFGGRALRSRKKLQEAKMASQKKREFKCTVCKKDFISQAILNNHFKVCKDKKGNKKSTGRSPLVKELPAARPLSPEKSKRGRKPKNISKAPSLRGLDSPTAFNVPVSRGPSTSAFNNESQDVFDDFGALNLGVQKHSDESEELRSGVQEEQMQVGKDGKVYCKRCKNTYRTMLSYNNHFGNCFYFSSDEENEEDLQPQVIETSIYTMAPSTTGFQNNSQPIDSESESTDSSILSDEPSTSTALVSKIQDLSSSLDERHETVSLQNELVADESGYNASVGFTQDFHGDEMLEREIDHNHNPESFNQPTENIPTAEEIVAEEEESQVEEETFLEETGETPLGSLIPEEQVIEAENEEDSEEMEEVPQGEAQNKNPDFDKIEQIQDSQVGIPSSEFLSSVEPVPNPGAGLGHSEQGFVYSGPSQLDLQSETNQQFFQMPSLAQQSSSVQQQQNHAFQPLQMQNFNGIPNFQIMDQLPGGPYNHQQAASSFQNQNQQPQTMPQQQLQTIPQQQLQTIPQQQLQTMTFQDTNTGQLVTIEVPVMPSQQQMLPAQSPVFMQQAFQNPQPQIQPNEAQAQFEQYKQQVQAAIQLQRNSLLQESQQETMYQQNHHQFHGSHEPRKFPEIQNQFPHSSGSSSACASTMLMAMNPNFQHHNRAQAHIAPAPPVQVARHHIQSQGTDGTTTYILQQFQHGNHGSASLGSLQYDTQSRVQHRPYQLANSETQRPLAPALHSPILLSVTENIPKVHSEQVPGSSHNCFRHLATQRAASCSCADCCRIPNSSTSLIEVHQPFWSIQKPLPVPSVRKPKTGKIRARLASIVSERQGQGLQLFRSLTSPNTTLPRLLPATAVVTSTTTSNSYSTAASALLLNDTVPTTAAPDLFKAPPSISVQVPTATANSDPLSGSVTSVSASTLLKAPTPSPIAVVRPMEHPLQKISNQIQQLESSFTTPVSSQIPITLGVTPSVPERVATSVNGISQAPNTASMPLTTPNVPKETNIVEPEAVQVQDEPIDKGEDIKEITEIKKPLAIDSEIPPADESPTPDQSIKIRLKRQAGGDSYSINKISGSTATSNSQFPGMFKTLKIKGKITTGDQAGTSTDVVVQPVVYTIPIPDPDADGDDEANRTIAEDDHGSESRTSLETSVVLPLPSSLDLEVDEKGQPRKTALRLTHRAVIVYEVKIDDKVQYKSGDVRAVWGYILERVQGTRRNHNLPPLAYPATNIFLPENKREAAASFNKLGLTHRAVQFLLEQLPGVKNAAKEGHIFKFQEPPKTSIDDTPVVENPTGAARSEGFTGRKPFDMFGWLASKHRQPEVPSVSTRSLDKMKGGSLPMAMKYRNLLKFGTKHLNVFWSSIHGRGLFTTKDIEVGDIIIEYAGEVIRPVLCDIREKYYESKGIGCYMFRIDDKSVVDATLKGNAARFINHSCDPNCRSKTIDILGKKHILILALRKIIAGEELTYDYKFEEEGEKLPCSCGTKKCRKFLN